MVRGARRLVDFLEKPEKSENKSIADKLKEKKVPLRPIQLTFFL